MDGPALASWLADPTALAETTDRVQRHRLRIACKLAEAALERLGVIKAARE